MAVDAGRIQPIDISDEMQQAFIDYAMSVISSRALPDVRDGLKPVHRRILFAMDEAGNTADKSFRKSAKTVGEVIGNYHPHSDVAVYDALVRLAQDFSLRYPLVEGHGNFGCFTGETKICLADGTTASFAELAARGPDARFDVFAVDQGGRIVIAEGRHARITRPQAELVRVVLDSGDAILCTPDHRFMLRDGSYRPAAELTASDSLMPGYFDRAPVRKGSGDYTRILQPDGTWSFVHHLADEFNAAHGRARVMNRGYVRHHRNFNRFDNRPENIERVTFAEHNAIHAMHLRTLWRDEAFRAAQRDGVRRYLADHPEAVERLRLQTQERNRNPEFRRKNGAKIARVLKGYYDRHPDKKRSLSDKHRALWESPAFRERMTTALRGLEKRRPSPVVQARVSALTSAQSRDRWANPSVKAEMRLAIRLGMAAPGVRARLSAVSKQRWSDPGYRGKFAVDHHRRMARALWDRPETTELHRAKIERQWSDPAFRSAQAAGVRASNCRRIAANPTMMAEVTKAAGEALCANWRDPSYRRRVMRTRIAHGMRDLLGDVGDQAASPAVYEQLRARARLPRLKTVLRYFDTFDELVTAARRYNHRVLRVEPLTSGEDVYDITVDGYHNFLLAAGIFVHNSIDADPAAAMRYTEARLSRLASEMLRDLDKDTVDFVPNYDEKSEEPVVLPSRFPNLLANGSTGIAVGMATNIPPHNLREVIDGAIAVIDDPEVTSRDLMRYVHGPDFPTAGLIMGAEGIRQAYETGRGSITLRAKAQIEELRGDRYRIVVTEIPYQVVKARLIERIAELVREKRVEGITDLRDESDRTGLRIVIELSRTANANVVLNKLFKETQMQQNFGVIMLALVDGHPRVLSLKQMLHHYVAHQREVVTRRSRFELDKAEKRAHILEGLRIALDHIDEVIALIRASQTTDEARDGLMSRFGLDQLQADAILDMRLQRLTGLEREKIDAEYDELQKTIEYLRAVLASAAMLDGIIKKELRDIRDRFGDDRRTEIAGAAGEFSVEDLIAEEDVVVTMTHRGYCKRLPVDTYRSQGRGGRGITGMATREQDFVEQLFVAGTHDNLLFFTNRGRSYALKVHEIPEAGRTARGTAAVNLIQLDGDEKITAVLPLPKQRDDAYLVLVTREGVIKRCATSEFDNVRRGGIIAMILDEGDELIDARLTSGSDEIMLITRRGRALRFPGSDLRPMGRSAHGVRGIRLASGDAVVAAAVAIRDADVLIISEFGIGKRTPVADFPVKHRGTGGVHAMRLSDRTGDLAGAQVLRPEHEVMLISAEGVVIRQTADGISRQSRSAGGVQIMRLEPGDRLAAVAPVVPRQGDAG